MLEETVQRVQYRERERDCWKMRSNNMYEESGWRERSRYSEREFV